MAEVLPAQLTAGLEAGVAPGADGLFFLPYLAGERTPHMDPHARGAWIGLTLAHEGPAGRKRLADHALAKAERIAGNVPIPHRELVYLNAASARAWVRESFTPSSSTYSKVTLRPLRSSM